MRLWFCSILLALLAGAAQAQQMGTPGRFDFYVLSLSWSPQYCATTGGPNSLQCAPQRHYGFVVHGLWPQYERGGYPARCISHDRLDNATVDSVLDIMPSPGLVRHEWTTHGACSGQRPAAYFAALRRAFQRIEMPEFYRHPTGKLSRLPSQLKHEMAAANPWLPESAMTVYCDGQYMQELRICLDRDFNPRACSATVRQQACREREFLVRPVR